MKRFVSLTQITISIALGLVLMASSPSMAIHRGAGDLVCGGCHTMHNSQNGAMNSMGGINGGTPTLLRGVVTTRAEMHKFCLQCHASNGAQASAQHAPQNVAAPKVYSNGSWDGTIDPFNKIGAGGNFSTEVDSTWNTTTPPAVGYGHSLGATAVVPPGGDASIAEFSCTNCHDPHGSINLADTKTNMFRNLKTKAVGSAGNGENDFYGVKFYTGATEWYKFKSYVGGVNGAYFGGGETDNAGNVIWPVFRGALTGDPVADSPNSNAYATDSARDANCPTGVGCNGSASVTMSRWCAQCHDSWHEDMNNGPVVDEKTNTLTSWQRHPVAGMLPRAAAAGCAQNCHRSFLDRSNYNLSLIQAGKGLPVTTSRYYTNNNVYYLPTDTVGAGAGGMDDLINGQNHKVFCLSCHFAHGGPYRDGLRWEHANATGVANGIPSNRGCQLCHNRGA